MNRIALSIALALGLAAGLPASADGPSPGAEVRLSTASMPPAWFDEVPEGSLSPIGDRSDEDAPILVKGRRSYSEDRALLDARSLLEQAIADWLAPEIPEGWPVPDDLVDGLILDQHVEPVLLDLDHLGLTGDSGQDLALPQVLYIAALRVDLSADRREALLDVHRQQLGARRLAMLGGLGGFVLACLAILSLYIRADEATLGYYTQRLRLLALASAASAGALIYRLVSLV